MKKEFEILPFGSFSDKVSEPMGTKRKYWLDVDAGPDSSKKWLFKVPRDGTGEHWAEKAGYELAKLIELPAARIELATLVLEDQPINGTASLSFTPNQVSLIHGNEMLQRLFPDYDKEKRYSQKQHRIDSIFAVLEAYNLAPPPLSRAIATTSCLVGYLLFDGWIANVDRHHENWGMLADGVDHLAPSYDHASSLGRLLSDRRRSRVLEGRERLTVEKFLTRSDASGAIYPLKGARVPPWKLVGDLVDMGFETEVRLWLHRIQAVDEEQLDEIFSAFPSDWMSQPAIEFAKAILDETPQLMHRELKQ